MTLATEVTRKVLMLKFLYQRRCASKPDTPQHSAARPAHTPAPDQHVSGSTQDPEMTKSYTGREMSEEYLMYNIVY